MALRLEDKKTLVAEVNAVAVGAHSAVVAEYRGMTVAEMTELRMKARQSGVYLRVVKNTLAKRAVQGTSFECMRDVLKGPLVLAFSQDHPGAAARLVQSFAKDHARLVPVSVTLRGKLLPPTELGRLATLPTREEALAKLLGVLQAPIAKFVRTLAEPQAKLVRTLAAVRDAKQAA